jgi:hypothetical protein
VIEVTSLLDTTQQKTPEFTHAAATIAPEITHNYNPYIVLDSTPSSMIYVGQHITTAAPPPPMTSATAAPSAD